jgi:nitrogen-specific signal transduction histidine kinase/CheY-like chemotaxis protein
MVVRDVTTRNRTATRLAQAERLMTLATLAAGVAHEVNNPLAYVQGNVTFAVTELKRLLATPELQAVAPQVNDTIVALEECFDGTRRMSDIVGQLRLLANAGPAGQLELAPVNVARSIAAAARLARNVVLHRATLAVDAPVDLAVMANETQLVQVLTNLLANAAQAMPEDADARRDIHVSARRHTQSVIITVTDTGVGMTEAQLVRVFDPFFTTKGPSEGMGLGMSISHQHVTGMGGTIDISSRVGEGTAVRLALSLAPPEVRPASPFGARSAVATGRGRVLIIDDEPMVAGSLARLLRRSHEVETRDDPAAALRLLLEDQAWDVVLCDVMMPGLDGAQLYQRAVAAHPTLRDSFAFVTGGAFTPQTIELLQTTHRPVFPKPVPISELEAFIARRVSQRAAPSTRLGDGSGE